jgi:hypothetical protein
VTGCHCDGVSVPCPGVSRIPPKRYA